MKSFVTILFSILLSSTISAAAAPVPITGKVTDAGTHEPLAGATASIPELKLTAVTDANGTFIFRSGPARGRFLVEIRYVGYRSISRPVTLPADSLVFALQPSAQEMHEVVITGSAVSSGKKQNSTSVASLTRAQLTVPSANVIDAIAKQVPGVSQITTGQAISKPVIRGLGYNRVVTLTDGVKQQGQQWGDEHGIEIDQFAPERVEVLRGAASLLYGSDALGGVINFIEPGAAPEGSLKGEALTSYSSNNGLSSSSLMLAGNSDGFVWMGRGSYKNAYSFNTPGGYYPNSGYNETNANGMLGLNKEWGYSHVTLSYYKNNIGFYEPEFDAAGNFVNEDGNPFSTDAYKSRTLAYPRQDVRHYKIGLNNNFLTGSGYLKATFGYQKNQRRELDGPDPELFFDLNTWSADLKYYFSGAESWQRVIGLSGDTGRSLNKGEEALVPDYTTSGFGIYGYAKKIMAGSSFNFGARYDYRSNTGKEMTDGATIIFSPFSNSFSNLSGAAGFTYELSETVNLKANAGSAFRAPNPAELGSNGVHEGTFRYEVGNSALNPERSYQADLTLEFDGKVLSGSFGVYTNAIRNYIYLVTTPGDNITLTDGTATTTYPVYRYGQVNARLSGLEGNVVLHAGAHVHFENSFSYTHAQNRTLDRPLPFIPAGIIRHELRFEPAIKGTSDSYASLGLENNFRQARVDTEFETAAAGYSLLSAGAGTTLKMGKQPLRLFVMASNLTDKRYYSALSRLRPGRFDSTNPAIGVYDPGRNIALGASLVF